LEVAFTNSSYEADFYLDTKTGQVLMVTDETRNILRMTDLQHGSADDVEVFDLEAALKRAGISDWQQEAVMEAAQIDADSEFRYLEVPKRSSREDYEIMEDFIVTVEDEQLQDQLWRAIKGRGAFRYFRQVISEDENELERWYAYKESRLMEEMMDWLEMEEIEPTNKEP
jgi:hypothetical protein